MIKYPSRPRRNFRTRAKNDIMGGLNFEAMNKLKGKEAIAYRKWLNDPKFKLTEMEKSILFGSLLTDATLAKRGIESYRMRIGHCPKQKQLVLWQYEKLKRLCGTTSEPKLTSKGDLIDFYPTSGRYLEPIHTLFYKKIDDILDTKGNKKSIWQKRITIELLDQMPKSPECLALIFLADGSIRSDAYSGKIALHCFSQKEQLLFANWLSSVHGIDVRVVRHTIASNQYYVSIPSKSFPKLIDIIEPIVQEMPDLCYKLNRERRSKSKNL